MFAFLLTFEESLAIIQATKNEKVCGCDWTKHPSKKGRFYAAGRGTVHHNE